MGLRLRGKHPLGTGKDSQGVPSPHLFLLPCPRSTIASFLLFSSATTVSFSPSLSSLDCCSSSSLAIALTACYGTADGGCQVTPVKAAEISQCDVTISVLSLMAQGFYMPLTFYFSFGGFMQTWISPPLVSPCLYMAPFCKCFDPYYGAIFKISYKGIQYTLNIF